MHYDCRAYIVWTLPPLLWRCNLCRKLGRLEQLTLLSVSGIGLFSKSTGFNSPIWIGKTRVSVGSESLPWQSSGWPFSLGTLRSTQLSWWTEYPTSRSRCRQSFLRKFDLFHDIGTQRGAIPGNRTWFHDTSALIHAPTGFPSSSCSDLPNNQPNPSAARNHAMPQPTLSSARRGVVDLRIKQRQAQNEEEPKKGRRMDLFRWLWCGDVLQSSLLWTGELT
jgi:hypothetical protein